MYELATEPNGARRRWLRETPDHRCFLRGLVCCLRHGQPPTPPQQSARDDWRCTPDRPDTHLAGKQTLILGAEREEEPLATTTKRITTGKCTGTDVIQHLHQRPACTCRHSQLHLRRRLVHRVARKRLQRHRSFTHFCPEHYDHLLRHEPTACEPFKDTCVCFPPKESRSQTRTECSVERYQTLKHNNTSYRRQNARVEQCATRATHVIFERKHCSRRRRHTQVELSSSRKCTD